ncbi:MAG: HlyD family secretion protein [Candidatus Longimicrobiales bacterium M2_2A_002]
MKRRIVAAALAIVAITAVTWVVLSDGSDASEIDASGTVEATDADLGFNAPGRIGEIAVREGDEVRRGAVLARLEASELEARKSVAEAQLEAARAALAELEAGARSEEIAQARAAVRAAEQRREDARRDLRRARVLQEGGAISQEALDKAETQAEVAEASLEQARQRLRALETGPRQERIRAQRAAVAAAEASVRQAEAALENTVVEAPFDGRITTRHRDPGETVQPGQPVVTLLDPDDRWVRIYVAEDRIGAVGIGEPAVITSDTYPDREYDGRVVFIAREAEFTPRNVQTREDRVKLVYAVRVEITGDPDYVLKPGTPADVRLVGRATASSAEDSAAGDPAAGDSAAGPGGSGPAGG